MINIPNLITAVRGLSVPVFVMSIHYSKPTLALAIFMLASVSDAFDGFIARKLNQVTMAGIIMDPIADKALINSGFIMLSMIKHVIPIWLTILVISRDVLILMGAWLFATFGRIEKVKPTLTGKITALFQFLAILVGLLYMNDYADELITVPVFYAAGVFTIVSAIDYSFKGVKELNA